MEHITWVCFLFSVFFFIVRWETKRTHNTAVTIVFHYCLLLPRGHGSARGATSWNLAIHSLVFVVCFLRVRVEFERNLRRFRLIECRNANDIS